MNMDEYEYNRDYKRRIITFMIITGLYLLFSAVYTATDLFIAHISWSDNGFLYAYCVYAVWFNAYTCYRYYKNSIIQEQMFKPKKEMSDFFEVVGFQPFDHKKGRRHIFMLSSLAIAVNIGLIIATRWLWL